MPPVTQGCHEIENKKCKGTRAYRGRDTDPADQITTWIFKADGKHREVVLMAKTAKELQVAFAYGIRRYGHMVEDCDLHGQSLLSKRVLGVHAQATCQAIADG